MKRINNKINQAVASGFFLRVFMAENQNNNQL